MDLGRGMVLAIGFVAILPACNGTTTAPNDPIQDATTDADTLPTCRPAVDF